MLRYKLYHFKSLASTQDKAKEFAKKGLSGIIIVAGMQTKGRGRFKRKWHSDKGGLWMSILLKPKNIQYLQYLTFAASIAVAKSIKKITRIDAKIKWPNDVHYKGKKLCGILTEGIFGKENHIAVGIGLNVNQYYFSGEIKNIAISLRIINKKTIDMEKLMKNIIDEFFNIYNNQYNKNKFQNISKIWRNYCDTMGKEVMVITKTRKLRGEAIGVDEDCNLLLKAKNKIIKIVEGDLSVRY